MKYRKLTDSGDYTFGQGTAEFLVNTPEAVAQAVGTRLRLSQGEWFLDLTEGTPYDTQILGAGTQTLYDQALQSRILDTIGVSEITAYSSVMDVNQRRLTVTCTISTIYGQASFTAVFGRYITPASTGRLDVDFVLNSSILG